MNKQELYDEGKKLTAIDLFITEECNMKCSYCFHKQSRNKLDLEQGKKVLNRLKEMSPDKMNITYFGGEPLMYPEVVLELSKHARTLWPKSNLHITTNGKYFDENMFREYRKLGIEMQVSFDGDKETQDECRGFFDIISENIKKILEIYPELVVRMTFTPDTVKNLAKNVVFIHGLGVTNIMHHATMESNWDVTSLEEYSYQLKNLYNYRRFCRRRGIPLFVHFIDRTLRTINDETPTELEFCMAGKSYMAIMPDGDVYPCHRAASNRIFKLGNIFNEKRPFVRGVFRGLDKESTRCSRECEAWRTCHSCPITHFLVNKDLNKPLLDTGYCNICKIENSMATQYLPIEIADQQGKLLGDLAIVVADIADTVLKQKAEKEDAKK